MANNVYDTVHVLCILCKYYSSLLNAINNHAHSHTTSDSAMA